MCDHFPVEIEIEMRNLTVTKQSQGLFLWVQLDYNQLRAWSLDRISGPSESRYIYRKCLLTMTSVQELSNDGCAAHRPGPAPVDLNQCGRHHVVVL